MNIFTIFGISVSTQTKLYLFKVKVIIYLKFKQSNRYTENVQIDDKSQFN